MMGLIYLGIGLCYPGITVERYQKRNFKVPKNCEMGVNVTNNFLRLFLDF